MCTSSRNIWLRMESRPKIAYRLIISAPIFCVTCSSPTLTYRTVVCGQCLAPPNTIYATFSTVYALIQELLIPSCMVLCGFMSCPSYH
ncbi:unnamed protein product [Adineta ricciae]|uniref:Uncharacterized protein n=1 Tax=Adineta ricciae TaxID=249248 RepID=A0A814KTY1_ADIRI|nr:unnamed protein product [Adineta ricciae]CAF1286990.1 unnamed protein product [Adineta ricciae]